MHQGRSNFCIISWDLISLAPISEGQGIAFRFVCRYSMYDCICFSEIIINPIYLKFQYKERSAHGSDLLDLVWTLNQIFIINITLGERAINIIFW